MLTFTLLCFCHLFKSSMISLTSLPTISTPLLTLRSTPLTSSHPHGSMSHAPPRRRALVLGMAFVTAEESSKAKRLAKKDTSNASCRDRARLLSLQSLGYDVMTWNNGKEVDVCEPNCHYSGDFGARGVKSLFKQVHTIQRGKNLKSF